MSETPPFTLLLTTITQLREARYALHHYTDTGRPYSGDGLSHKSAGVHEQTTPFLQGLLSLVTTISGAIASA